LSKAKHLPTWVAFCLLAAPFAAAAELAVAAPATRPSRPTAAANAATAVAAALIPKPYPDPARFEKAIRAFEAADAKLTPPPGGIVCVGSSSMAGWHATLKQDLAPLPVIGRGFGGSNMNDALHFVDRVVTRYRPRAVVLYEGDNDLAQGVPPEKIRDTFVAFAAAVHRQLPDTRIYVLSIKPSPARWALWARTLEANRLLQAACAADAKRLNYVSIVEPMLGPDGQPLAAIFKTDRLHMTAKGYALWRDVLRPVLMKHEAPLAMDAK
jgi:lysophospholipase L1-like esterase